VREYQDRKMVTDNSDGFDSLKRLFLPVNLLYGSIAIVILISLYLISLQNYILFHGIVELAGITVAFSIFILVWNTRSITNTFFLIVGISFLFAGSLDLIHTLAYKGMGVFPGNSSDLPTELWIAARYFQSITFLIATFFIGKSISRNREYDAGIIFAACTVSCGLLLASIFVWHNFPACFIEGSGLTPFKIISEYIISLILIATIILLVIKRKSFETGVWQLLIAAQIFLILGELAFTSYISVYGFMNMLGHLFRLISVYLFYRAFVVVGLTRPYDLLLRELKKNETALRLKGEELQIIIDKAPAMIFFKDTKNNFIKVNPAGARAFGMTVDKIEGKNTADLFPDFAEKYYQDDLEVINSGKPKLGITEPMTIASGEQLWVQTDKIPLMDEQGTITGVLLFVVDITERKRAEDALKASEELFRLSIDKAPEAIFLFDVTRNRYVDANARAEQLFGCSRQKLLDSGPLQFYRSDPSDVQSVSDTMDEYHRRVLAGETVMFERNIRTARNEDLVMEVRLVALQSADSRLIRSSFIDITERKHAQEALALAGKKLNLLSSITRHDIRNQLMALNAYIALSEEAIGNPVELKEFIFKEQKIADSIANQIAFTKDYEELGVKTPVWQNVNALIRDTVTALPLRNIILDIQCPGLEVFADPLLEKVFFNLIDNSLRYGEEKMTTIRVTATEGNATLRIIYEDDGSGISAYDKKELFTKGFGKHTGLGLFLSREILSLTGITITENGEPGKGARFEIEVPKGGYRFADR
jgi:PAS domain S-box-containing protein